VQAGRKPKLTPPEKPDARSSEVEKSGGNNEVDSGISHNNNKNHNNSNNSDNESAGDNDSRDGISQVADPESSSNALQVRMWR
jgi:hypothetical protein